MIPPAPPPAATQRPPDRYGDAPRPRRLWLVVAAVVASVAVGWIIWSVVQLLSPPVKAAMVGWTSPVDNELTVTVEIRRDPELAVTCDVVAVDDRLAEIGRSTIRVPADGRKHLRVSTAIAFEGRAIAAELRGCTTTG